MYEGTKKAFGPSSQQDYSPQLNLTRDHYRARQAAVLQGDHRSTASTVIKNTTPLPTMDELDTPPTIDELRKAIKSLANCKVQAVTAYPEIVKRLSNESILLGHFHDLLLQCWEEGKTPQDCNNY